MKFVFMKNNYVYSFIRPLSAGTLVVPDVATENRRSYQGRLCSVTRSGAIIDNQ